MTTGSSELDCAVLKYLVEKKLPAAIVQGFKESTGTVNSTVPRIHHVNKTTCCLGMGVTLESWPR